MKFGENLYNLRKSQKLSQEKLAEKVGVSRQSVSKWERGEAYPEMNRLIMLCKIFHCQLNDLVNDRLLDINSLDEEIKMNVIKFEKEKQKKLKFITKVIMWFTKVLQIITLLISILLFIAMFIMPSIVNSVNINDSNISIYSTQLQHFNVNNQTISILLDLYRTHSRMNIIFYGEIIILCLIVSVLILSAMMLYTNKLFKNINESNTPFTLENMQYIKKIIFFLITYLVFPDIAGTLFQLVTKINMNIDYEIGKVFFILIIICGYYIFDYGYQIQLDSKGRIYGDEYE